MHAPCSGGHTAQGEAEFAATRWSVVLAAAGQRADGDAASTSTSRRALEELFGAYWFPLYAFVRRQGNNPHQAEDLTQGFFAHLLENDGLKAVNPAKGKFRSFLLAGLKHYWADELDKARASKRGGNRKILSLDAASAEATYAREPSDTMTPEKLFERSWAITVLNNVLRRLESDYHSRGKGREFQSLRHVLDGQADERSHGQIATELGVSAGAVRVMAHRLRRQYRELLRDEIALTVADEKQVDEEIRYLLQCL